MCSFFGWAYLMPGSRQIGRLDLAVNETHSTGSKTEISRGGSGPRSQTDQFAVLMDRRYSWATGLVKRVT
jgi:hypothetical protein